MENNENLDFLILETEVETDTNFITIFSFIIILSLLGLAFFVIFKKTTTKNLPPPSLKYYCGEIQPPAISPCIPQPVPGNCPPPPAPLPPQPCPPGPPSCTPAPPLSPTKFCFSIGQNEKKGDKTLYDTQADCCKVCGC